MLGADGYGVREEFDAAVDTAVADDGRGGTHSAYTWQTATYNATSVGEVSVVWR